jgi:hypothetical protein
MGLFDRFRAQPKWKHADAAVRIEAVEELSIEEEDLLTALAREDADARVRQAAVQKLFKPALLERIAAEDSEAGVRQAAQEVLLDMATGAFEDSSEAESLEALSRIADPRQIAAVAKSASSEAVSLAALTRVGDARTLGSIARSAEHPSTRTQALERLEDLEEIVAVALKSDHRDVALSAAERLGDVGHLRTVATKAANKAVARRARTMLHDLEQAQAAASAVEPEVPAAPSGNRERDEICRRLEQAVSGGSRAAIEGALRSTAEQWAVIPGDPEPLRASRYATAQDKARRAVARLETEEAERSRKAEEVAREEAGRESLCASVEQLSAALPAALAARGDAGQRLALLDETLAGVAEARERWNALEARFLAPAAIERLERRFDRATGGCEREVQRARDLEARRGRMQELVEQAEAMAIAKPGAESRDRWKTLTQEWTDLCAGAARDETLASRFEAARSRFTERENEAREHEARRQREETERMAELADRSEAAAGAETITLKEGERALRDIRSALEHAAVHSSRRERSDLVERLKVAQSRLFPRVSELREADEWVRWANVGIQEDLCRRAEALLEQPDPGKAAAELRELQQQWKKASVVPRDKAQQLWERFKKASDGVHERTKVYFAQQASERTANLERKEALCQQAESLAESSDWIQTAEAIKKLQVEWKAVGPVSRGQEKAVWERFRAACDRFFVRRREDLTRRREQWSANLARKEALIARVDELAQGCDWDRAVEEAKRAQAEWKTIGPVRKNRSEDVWQRFRGACDRFFERYQQRDNLQVAANVEAREALCAELESMAGAAAVAGEPVEGVRQRTDSIRARWQQAPTLMPRDVLAGLSERFNRGLVSLVSAAPGVFRGSDLDPDELRRRAEALCDRVEKLLPSEPDVTGQPPAVVLAARLREALAANTIGGVSVADAEVRAREDMAAVREAQAAWAALGPLADETRDALNLRFERACQRFFAAREKRN